jgi:hypothetical protein
MPTPKVPIVPIVSMGRKAEVAAVIRNGGAGPEAAAAVATASVHRGTGMPP